MKITKRQIKLKDIAKGYKDSGESGVVGFNGQLNIRPAYQREFIYKDKQRDAVIDTIVKGFPLNTIYWAKNEDGTYEIIDGQQRTVSFSKYINNEYAINFRSWVNLTQAEREQILNYEVDVYICEGTDEEKLNWFRTINIAGEKLTDQELLNATYTGPWLADAKHYFSRTNCPAYNIAKDYVTGSPIRQNFLETALDWISNGNIEKYMAEHQHDFDASELWSYFKSVIEWVQTIYPEYQKEMKGVEWGLLFNRFGKDVTQYVDGMTDRVRILLIDEDVTKRSGIYEYLLSGNEKVLSIRAFPEAVKRAIYIEQSGICAHCGDQFEYNQMQADHIIPWSKGGRSIRENCQMLCVKCNNSKSNK